MEVDIVDYGDVDTFIRLRDTFSRYYMITFTGGKTQNEQAADKAAHAVLANWVSFPGTPDIILTDKDSGFIGSGLSRFCNV